VIDEEEDEELLNLQEMLDEERAANENDSDRDAVLALTTCHVSDSSRSDDNSDCSSDEDILGTPAIPSLVKHTGQSENAVLETNQLQADHTYEHTEIKNNSIEIEKNSLKIADEKNYKYERNEDKCCSLECIKEVNKSEAKEHMSSGLLGIEPLPLSDHAEDVLSCDGIEECIPTSCLHPASPEQLTESLPDLIEETSIQVPAPDQLGFSREDLEADLKNVDAALSNITSALENSQLENSLVKANVSDSIDTIGKLSSEMDKAKAEMEATTNLSMFTDELPDDDLLDDEDASTITPVAKNDRFQPAILKKTDASADNDKESVVSGASSAYGAMTRVLSELGGFVLDYSAHFANFGEIFSLYSTCSKQTRVKVVEETIGTFIQLYTSANRVLGMHMNKKWDGDDLWAMHAHERFYRVLSRSRNEVSNIIKDSCENLHAIALDRSLVSMLTGRKEVHRGCKSPMVELPDNLGSLWNFLWTWSKPKVNRDELLVWQKVNHFVLSRNLTRKDLLKNELQRYRSMSKYLWREFELLPDTYILRKEYIQFVDAFSRHEETNINLWIMKPVGLSRGRGISLVADIGDVCYDQSVIIQRYIPNPMLLDGYKFDLRIYVLVTSFSPLEAWIYDEGFVRVCTQKYNTEDMDVKNLMVHLTNSSIQQMGANGGGCATTRQTIDRHGAGIDEAGGTKLSLAYLWRRLKADGHDVEAVKTSIKLLILKSLVCCNEKVPHQPNCFEVYGYDVLLDQQMRPWLIEINSSPSLAQENQLDTRIKRAMIADTLRLVNPMSFDREVFLDVLHSRAKEMERNRLRAFQRRSSNSEQDRLNKELTGIFRGQIPRSYGEMPEYQGGYSRLCPDEEVYESVQKIIKQERDSNKTSGSRPKRMKRVQVPLSGRPGLFHIAKEAGIAL